VLRAAAHREDACSGTETSLAVRVRKATNSERFGQPRRCRRELPRRRSVGKEPQLRHGVEIVGPKSWSWSPGADVQNCVEGPSQTGPQGLVMDCGTLSTRKGSNYPWSAQVARCPFKAHIPCTHVVSSLISGPKSARGLLFQPVKYFENGYQSSGGAVRRGVGQFFGFFFSRHPYSRAHTKSNISALDSVDSCYAAL